jgi:hypothetical protein
LQEAEKFSGQNLRLREIVAGKTMKLERLLRVGLGVL